MHYGNYVAAAVPDHQADCSVVAAVNAGASFQWKSDFVPAVYYERSIVELLAVAAAAAKADNGCLTVEDIEKAAETA